MIIADHWNDGPPAWFIVWPILFFLFWGAVIFFAVLAWRRGTWGARGSHADHTHRSAQALLAERYARGEISEDEYRERRTVLTEGEK